MRSLELINQGTASEFVDALIQEVMTHPAVGHEYLCRFSEGAFPDMPGAVLDYAYQYHYYSELFAQSLAAVIGHVGNPGHRKLLTENLDEELGVGADGQGREMTHADMFSEFRYKAGVTAEFEAAHAPCSTVLIWRELFLQKCQTPDVGVGVGGIGIGTEMIISSVYRQLLEGMRSHGHVADEDLRFFELHIDCDEDHGEAFVQVARDLAEGSALRESLRFGAISALNLRAAFWDVMLGRALGMRG